MQNFSLNKKVNRKKQKQWSLSEIIEWKLYIYIFLVVVSLYAQNVWETWSELVRTVGLSQKKKCRLNTTEEKKSL